MFGMSDKKRGGPLGALATGAGRLRNYVSRGFGNLKLRHKYLFSHAVIVFISVLILSPASYYITRTQVERRAVEFSSTFLQKAAFIWETKISEIVDYFLIQFDAFNLGSQLKAGPEEGGNLIRIRVEKFLADVITYKTGIRFILIETLDGDRYFRQRDGQGFSGAVIPRRIPYGYVQALRARPVFQTLDDGTILMSKVMYDLRTTEYLGVLSVGFDPETFSIVFPESDTAALGALLIADERWDRAVLASPGSAGLLPEYRADAGARQNIRGVSYLVDEVVTRDNRWRLLTYTPIPALAELSFTAELYILIAAALALAAAVILSFVLSARETERILRIQRYANRIASGNLDGHSIDSHADELGQLSGTLEDLSNRIAGLVEGLASEKLRMSEIRFSALQFEYGALQSQINPHFLYNTLEMINAMAKVKGETEISDTIQILGDLMRESLRGTKKLIPLDDELSYITKYLQIQRILHEEKLETVIDVPDGLRRVLVPNFILQPIVENAIVHGIDPKPGMGRLAVTAREAEGRLVLSVEDNGVGMDAERIRAVMNREIKEDKVHAKMGLANVNRRILIVYGGGSGMDIASEPGKGTRVSLTVPTEAGGGE